MKLKKVIETVEGLDAVIAGLYEKKADGKYHLSLEDDDAEPLRRAKDHEVGLRQIAERDLATATAELAASKEEVRKLKEDAGKSVQDVRDQLQKEWSDKLAKQQADHEAESGGLKNTIKRVFVNDVALRIASDISDVPDLLTPLLEKRLQVEIVNNEPVTRVLTEDGKASSMTPDELKAEYSQNKKFERIIRGSSASGGGAGGGKGGSGTSKKFEDMGDEERAEFHARDPEGFQRASAAHKAASNAF